MSDVLKARATRMARRAQRVFESARPAEEVALTWEDEVALAARYDADRGFGRPVALRSKEAHEHAEHAPRVTWAVSNRA